MDALSGHVVKFSLRHILNAGQYDFLSHIDSFGDIPGHEVVYFLGRKILWTLKSNLVLSLGMSFAALFIKSIIEEHGQRCQWTYSGNCR